MILKLWTSTHSLLLNSPHKATFERHRPLRKVCNQNSFPLRLLRSASCSCCQFLSASFPYLYSIDRYCFLYSHCYLVPLSARLMYRAVWLDFVANQRHFVTPPLYQQYTGDPFIVKLPKTGLEVWHPTPSTDSKNISIYYNFSTMYERRAKFCTYHNTSTYSLCLRSITCRYASANGHTTAALHPSSHPSRNTSGSLPNKDLTMNSRPKGFVSL